MSRISLGLGALMEVPGLVCAGWLARRVGLRWLLMLSVVPFALCIALWGALPSLTAIIVTRLVTGYFYGTLTAARVLVVPRLLPASIQATGQSLAQAATVGLGSVLGALIGGAIYESHGRGGVLRDLGDAHLRRRRGRLVRPARTARGTRARRRGDALRVDRGRPRRDARLGLTWCRQRQPRQCEATPPTAARGSSVEGVPGASTRRMPHSPASAYGMR